MVRALPCHGRGYGFEPRRSRHFFPDFLRILGLYRRHFPSGSKRFLALFAYGVTDESFAVNMARFNQGSWNRYSALVVNQSTNATWFFSSVAGAYLGQFIPTGSFGIDYALTGMFICLLVFQLRGALFVVTALIAALCSVSAYILLPGNTYVIVASCLAATAGFALKRTVFSRRPAP